MNINIMRRSIFTFKSILELLILIFSANSLLADDNQHKIDTNSSVNLPQIEIIEQHSNSNTAIQYLPNTILSKQTIELVMPMQISDILTFTPGININNYGGLSGMKTLSIRGMGSMRSLIMLDGVPINSSQNGSFDLNNISVSMIDNIEIVRGGASAIFGGNAIGGAINIKTNYTPAEILQANVSYGSFEEIGINITGNYVNKNSNNLKNNIDFVSANVNILNSKGNFPFYYSNFGELTKYYRKNSDYSNLLFSISSKGNVNNWTLWTRAMISNIDKGVPGAILQGKINKSDTRLLENNYSLLFNVDKAFYNLSNLSISSIIRHNFTKYLEPSKISMPETKYLLNEFSIIPKYNFSFLNLNNEIIGSLAYCSLNGDMLDPSVSSNVGRAIIALGYRIDKNVNIQNNLLNISAGIRTDNAINNNQRTNNQNALSATTGMMYLISNDMLPLLIRTNYAHSFRFPTFNEMYYKNYGNINLSPETSDNFNVGVELECFSIFTFCINGFYINTKDMITSIPTSPVAWSAKNVAKVISNGLELAISSNLSNNKLKLFNDYSLIFNCMLSYSFQNTLDKSNNSITFNKQLPYTPTKLFGYIFSINLVSNSANIIEIGATGEHSGFRYIQPDNAKNAILPNYFTNILFLSKNFTISNAIKLNIRVECVNIFDARYEIISNYLMPGRTFRISIGIKY